MREKSFIKPSNAAKRLGVSLHTLRRWDKKGLIETIKTDNGQRRYNVDDYIERKGIEDSGKYDKNIVTEIKPASDYWLASDEHQQYFEKKNQLRLQD